MVRSGHGSGHGSSVSAGQSGYALFHEHDASTARHGSSVSAGQSGHGSGHARARSPRARIPALFRRAGGLRGGTL